MYFKMIHVRGSKETLAAMLTIKRLSKCRTKGEFEDATMGSNLALKPRTDVTRNPKQRYQWPPKTLKKKNSHTANAATVLVGAQSRVSI